MKGAEAAVRIGTVKALAVRPAGSPAPLAVTTVAALAGVGLHGDRHADASSPRQLLLAGAGVYEDLGLAPHALRENLLLGFDTGLGLDTARLASGTVLQVGDQVRLRMMFQCEACGQLDLVQPRLAQRVGNRRGMLARVLAGGDIRCGDTVRDLGVLQPAWDDDWRERVRRVLDAVPPGCVVEYRDLARLAGIQSSYCRAFPRLLVRLGENYAARAASAKSAAMLARWDGDGLFDAS